MKDPGPPLDEVSFSTTYTVLSEEVAAVLGYRLAQRHFCMECGDKVGAGSMDNHARWHAGLPPKPKKGADGQPAEQGGSQ
jgi:hypothetical protein